MPLLLSSRCCWQHRLPRLLHSWQNCLKMLGKLLEMQQVYLLNVQKMTGEGVTDIAPNLEKQSC